MNTENFIKVLLNEASDLNAESVTINSNLTEDQKTQYNEYLSQHIGNVKKGYQWLVTNLPEFTSKEFLYGDSDPIYGTMEDIISIHDKSKYKNFGLSFEYMNLAKEYDPYGEYFYGEKTDEVKKEFNLAWLHHIHANPHHWQHWVLIHDDEGPECLDIPNVFIIEMICDWWSFSWKQGNLMEVFSWYDEHKPGIQMSDKTRNTVELILSKIKEKL